jgi:aldehyde:ferredoxin oxidoreductase
MTMDQGLALGKKIWNLDKAIWVLQGRHRDQEVFTNYVYDVPTSAPYFLLAKEDGEWGYSICLGRTLDRARFEDVKDRFYAMQGWDVATGWPTRSGLEAVGLSAVADELDKAGKLGG